MEIYRDLTPSRAKRTGGARSPSPARRFLLVLWPFSSEWAPHFAAAHCLAHARKGKKEAAGMPRDLCGASEPYIERGRGWGKKRSRKEQSSGSVEQGSRLVSFLPTILLHGMTKIRATGEQRRGNAPAKKYALLPPPPLPASASPPYAPLFSLHIARSLQFLPCPLPLFQCCAISSLPPPRGHFMPQDLPLALLSL